MITVTATAHCHGCGWTAGPADWPTIDREAGKHTKPGHPTGTEARPA